MGRAAGADGAGDGDGEGERPEEEVDMLRTAVMVLREGRGSVGCWLLGSGGDGETERGRSNWDGLEWVRLGGGLFFFPTEGLCMIV